MSKNKVILVGNLGDVPDLRVMPSGSSVANFSVATSEKWKDKQTGENKEKTEWTNCKAFDRGNYLMAQYIAQGCQKGTKIYVEGKLETEEYEKDGIKRYSTKVNVTDFEILANGIPKDGQGQQGGFNQQPAPQAKPQSFGSFGGGQADQRWSSVKGTAMTNGATIEQIQKKFNGSFDEAQKAGAIEPKPQQAPNFDDFDDDIPFN